MRRGVRVPAHRAATGPRARRPAAIPASEPSPSGTEAEEADRRRAERWGAEVSQMGNRRLMARKLSPPGKLSVARDS